MEGWKTEANKRQHQTTSPKRKKIATTMPVHTIRDLNNETPPTGGNQRPSGGGRSLGGGGGGRALGGGGGGGSSSGRVLNTGEAVSFQPSSANYPESGNLDAPTASAAGPQSSSGGFGSMFSRFGSMFSPSTTSSSPNQAYTAGGQRVDVESGQANTNTNPMQQQYETNEDMFWSFNLHGIQPQWYHMCLMCCCPCFVGPLCSPVRKQDYRRMLMTFCFWVSILQIVYFIVELSVGGVDGANRSIGPPSSTLLLLGAKSSYLIKREYQLWRLVVPLIMHAGFLHIFMNLFIQVMVCMGYEKNWKWYRVLPIYLVSGIGGNLLSCVALPDSISVGASGAIMGLIGAKVSNIILRWRKIPPQAKLMQCINVGFIIVITLLWSFSDYIDWSGHVGGLVCGFVFGFACFALSEIEDRIYKWTVFGMSVGLTLIYFLTISLVFGLTTQVTSPY